MSDLSVSAETRNATIVLAAQEAGLPGDLMPFLELFIEMAPQPFIDSVMADAMLAVGLKNQGRIEEARAIVESHRASAEEYGFGQIFDTILADIA